MKSLEWRYATKVFDPSKKISDKDFQKLIDALILTPSSYGLQPWKFVVVENPQVREELKPHSWGQPQITDASHLLVFCKVQNVDEPFVDKYIQSTAEIRNQETSELDGFKGMMISNVVDGMSDKARNQWARNQVYIALGNAMTVAGALEIDACPIEGFSPEKYDEILGLKEQGLASVVVLPVGYRSDDDKYADLPKVRFGEDDMILKI